MPLYGPAASGSVATDTIFTTKGDTVAATANAAAARVGVGTNNQVLTADSTQTAGVKWATAPAGSVASDAIFTTKGDLPVGTGAATAARLGAGTNGQALTAQSAQTTGLQWATLTTVATDTLFTTKGDIAAATGASAAARLAAGSNGQALTAQSGQTTGLQWATLTTVATDTVFTTKGDLAVATGNAAAARLAAGSNGQALTAQSGQTTGLQWATLTTVATDTVFTTKGDLAVATGNAASARLAVGATAGDSLEVDSTQTTGLKYSSVFTRPQGVNAQTGTTYILAATDAGKLVTLSNASAITLTVPQDSDATIAVGCYIDLYQLGAGQVTVAAGTGATLRTSGLTAKARAQYSRFMVQKVSANTWSLAGDLAAS